MEGRFVLQGASLEEARARLEDALGKDLGETGAQVVIGWLRRIADEGDKVEVVPGQAGLRRRGLVPGTRVFIDIRRAAITFTALLMDAIETRGLFLGTLVATGYDPKCIALLSMKEGELCNFLSLETLDAANFPVTSASLAAITAQKECPHPQFECRHMSGSICGIDKAAVDRNIGEFAGMRSIELTADGAIRRTR